jgi:cytochrome P450
MLARGCINAAIRVGAVLQGLIPADMETWKKRRPAIQPGFHKAWLDRMSQTFNQCSDVMLESLDKSVARGDAINMEEKFNSVSLDIIGKVALSLSLSLSLSHQRP